MVFSKEEADSAQSWLFQHLLDRGRQTFNSIAQPPYNIRTQSLSMVKMAASTSSAAARVGKSSGKFHPPKGYSFPVRTFGTKGEKRSFRSDWCVKYDWLHYQTAR